MRLWEQAPFPAALEPRCGGAAETLAGDVGDEIRCAGGRDSDFDDALVRSEEPGAEPDPGIGKPLVFVRGYNGLRKRHCVSLALHLAEGEEFRYRR